MMYNRRKIVYNIAKSDYKFIERNEDDFYTVELLTGEWKGTKYQYGKVSAKVDEITEDDEGIASLSFRWTLIEGDETLDGNPQFQDHIGGVLQHILEDAFETGDYKIGNDNDNSTTDNDSKEPSDKQ